MSHMRETLEREIKLAPVAGFCASRARRRAAADARLRLHLPRHARAQARPVRRHVPGTASRTARASGSSTSCPVERPGSSWSCRGRRPGRPGSWWRCSRRTCAAASLCRRWHDSAPGGKACVRWAGRSSTTTLPCSRGSASHGASGRSRSSCSRATSEHCDSSSRSFAGRADGAAPLKPKFYRALDLADVIEPRIVTKGMPPGEALGIALEREYRALLAHDPGTRRGDDPGKPAPAPGRDAAPPGVPPGRPPARRPRLGEPRCARRWAGSAGHLGPARDLDVMLGRLRADVAALGPGRPTDDRPARRVRGRAGSRLP